MILREEAATQNWVVKGPLSGLDNLNTPARMERRQYPRFKVDSCAFAMIRPANSRPIKIADLSMSEIACAVYRATPVKLGRIQNISIGGLMFHYVDYPVPAENLSLLDVILADCAIYVANLEFKAVADHELPTTFPDNVVQMKQLQVKFEKLAAYRIARFVHTVNRLNSCLEG